MFQAFRNRGILWKEWRGKSRTLWVLLAAIFIGTPALSPFLKSASYDFGTNGREWMLAAAGIFLAAVLALGSLFLDHDEHDPGRSFLYALPVSRRRILTAKLGALASQWVALLVAALLPFLWWKAMTWQPDYSYGSAPISAEYRRLQAQVGLGWAEVLGCALAMPVLAAILQIHLRSGIVTAFVTIAGMIPLITILKFREHAATEWDYYNCFSLFFNFVILSLALVAWLFFVFCRTPLQELRPTARMLLALLFLAALSELAFTVFLCDWRDLVFVTVGI